MMDAEALMHPRGPLPPGVYWRRRLVTVGGLVLILSLLLRSCGGDDPGTDRLRSGGTPTPTVSTAPSTPAGTSGQPTVAPTASRTAGPSASASASAGTGVCRNSDLQLTATTDKDTYAAGERPRLTISVVNKTETSCTRDIGQAARELRVVSGDDRIWSSDDCAPGGAAEVVTLRPGDRKTFSVTWGRRRSAVGCPAERDVAAAGTYRVVARLGDLVVRGGTFRLEA